MAREIDPVELKSSSNTLRPLPGYVSRLPSRLTGIQIPTRYGATPKDAIISHLNDYGDPPRVIIFDSNDASVLVIDTEKGLTVTYTGILKCPYGDYYMYDVK